MPSKTVVREANTAYAPSYTPVVVITGATSGIGEALAILLANNLHGRLQLIIVGRNQAAAERIISTLPPAAGDGFYEFMPCDVNLMKNVHELAQKIQNRVQKLNFLVHSAGIFGLGGRQDTEEGLDVKLASRYYSRWALTNDLLPLLQKASDAGEKASVLSILAAGQGSEVDVHDLGLQTSYSGLKAITRSASYNDLWVYEAASRHPSIAFTHIFPGNVDTPAYAFTNPILKVVGFLLRPLLWLLLKSKEDCADYMLYALLDADKGAYRRNQLGDDIALKGFPKAKDAQALLWEHSKEATTV